MHPNSCMHHLDTMIDVQWPTAFVLCDAFRDTDWNTLLHGQRHDDSGSRCDVDRSMPTIRCRYDAPNTKQLIRCYQITAFNTMQLMSCNWYDAANSTQLMYCIWCTASNVLHLILMCCSWCTASDVLHVMYCSWCTACNVLHLMYCSWHIACNTAANVMYCN